MGKITVIGLGAGELDQMPLGVYQLLINTKQTIFTRTKDHPVVSQLEENGVNFKSFDEVYESYNDFQSVYQEIVNQLIDLSEKGDVIYTVPGHPMVAEKTVQLLIEQKQDLDIKSGQSFLDSLFQTVKVDPIEGFQLLDGTDLRRSDIQYTQHVFIAQVYDQMVVSDVKITLMEDLPHDYPVKVIEAAGTSVEKVKSIPLFELDHNFEFSNLTTLYLQPADANLFHHQFDALRKVVATLRGPNGCPWDRKQTHESLRRFLIEEAYEVIEAIDEKDDDHLAEELGDVLLQVMLHSQIAEDLGYFTVDDVVRSITDKMIERHPHVFGDVEVENEEDVKENWEKIKQRNKPKQSSVLDDLNKSLPRSLFALEVQKKASKAGFDWKRKTDDVFKELKEFEQALSKSTYEEAERVFGDVLFSLISISRNQKIDPEIALQRACEQFIHHFKAMESTIKNEGLSLKDLSDDQWEKYWIEAKRIH